MKLTNDQYVIRLGTATWTERYFRDRGGWWKVSARGRRFRLTAEQVLNHLLPALAGVKPKVRADVKHRGRRSVRAAKARAPRRLRRARRPRRGSP